MAHDAPALCALRDVTKCYARRAAPALGPISLSVSGGEILGIRGPNGAGKSTLLGVMAGVLRPSGGERSCACRVGYVPQELSLYSALTAAENLRFWGLAQGLPGKIAPARARWLLGELELSDKGEPVSALSGGMKRRLHLATALMATPELLLLDEPTVGADDPSAALILALLERLAGQGCSIVLTSHRAGELEQVCSRILTLEAGRPVREEVRPWER